VSWGAVVSGCGGGFVAFAGRAAPVTAPDFEGDAEVRDFDGCAVGVAVFLPAAAGALAPPTSLLSAPVRRLTALPADLAAAEVFCTTAVGLCRVPEALRAAGGAARPEAVDFPPWRAPAAFFASGFFAAAPRAFLADAGVFVAVGFFAVGFFAAGFFAAAFFGSALAAAFLAAGDFAAEVFLDGPVFAATVFAARVFEAGAGFFGAALLAAAFFTAGFFAAFAGEDLAAAFLLPAATGFLFGLDFMGVLGFPWAASRRSARFASLRRSGRVL